MNELVTKYLTPLKTFWIKLGKKMQIILISVIGGVLVLAIALTLLLGQKKYVALYTNITTDQSTEVLAALAAIGAECKVEDGGKTILVDEKVEPKVRMQMASTGFPKVVPNYDFFLNNIDFMTTESEKRSIELFSMEIKMRDSIKSIEGIEDAIVTIARPPEEKGYAWESDTYKPTASAQVFLLPGVKLTGEQVSGIKNVVASGNIGLSVGDVVVTDGSGNILKGSEDTQYVDINNFKLDIEHQISTEKRNQILSTIGPTFGTSNIDVGVNVVYNLDKKIKELITHTPSTEDGNGIVNESEIDKEQIKPDGTNGGVVGEENNEEPPEYAGVTLDDGNIYYKDYENYKYAVNKATEQITSEAGFLENVTAGISINQTARNLTNDEKQELIQMVANVAGISAANVTVLNLPFDVPEVLGEGEQEIWQNPIFIMSVSGAALLLLIVLVIVFIVNGKIKKKRKALAEAAEAEALANANAIVIPVGDSLNMEEDLKNTPESREHALRKEIQDFSVKNPMIVAQLIKTWLRGENDE